MYLIGNPVVWYASTIGVLLYLGVRALLVLRAQRGYRDLSRREFKVFSSMSSQNSPS